jgi:hypothetical protein
MSVRARPARVIHNFRRAAKVLRYSEAMRLAMTRPAMRSAGASQFGPKFARFISPKIFFGNTFNGATRRFANDRTYASPQVFKPSSFH